MDEYIERGRLLRKFNIDDMMNVNGTLISLRDAREVISNSPAADIAPEVRRGKWLNSSDRPDKNICSLCGYGEDMWWSDKGTDYCPNCGADMREVEHE